MRRTPMPRAKSPLKRKTPLRQVSVRRAAAAGKQVVSTLNPGRRATGPDGATVELVLERDRWSCARCGSAVGDRRGIDWSAHHRRPRAAGGSRRADTNSPANTVTLCGSGTTGCHGDVESGRAAARAAGFLVHQADDPTTVPVFHAAYGWVLLRADGGVTPVREARAA